VTPEQRQAIIQALLQKDLNAIRQEKGEVFVIRDFFSHLQFSQTEGRTLADFDKIIFAPGEYRTFLENRSTDPDGKLTGIPFWWVPADGLSDEQVEKYKG
jgi:hypothetical protein